MTGWETGPAASVRIGDHVRRGEYELRVTAIQERFFGREDMIAFIEDSPRQWLKIPARVDADVELRRDA